MSAALTLVRPARRTLEQYVRDVDLVSMTLETLEAAEEPIEVLNQIEAQLLDVITGTRKKIDSTAGVLAAFESDALLCQREIDRLTERQARLVKYRQRLESYVIHVAMTSGVTKLEGHTSTLAVHKNAPSLLIDPGTEIPAEFMRTPAPPPPPPPAPDKNAIKAAMKRGMHFAGCRLQQTLKLVRS